jgi:hypothetical protein
MLFSFTSSDSIILVFAAVSLLIDPRFRESVQTIVAFSITFQAYSQQPSIFPFFATGLFNAVLLNTFRSPRDVDSRWLVLDAD